MNSDFATVGKGWAGTTPKLSLRARLSVSSRPSAGRPGVGRVRRAHIPLACGFEEAARPYRAAPTGFGLGHEPCDFAVVGYVLPAESRSSSSRAITAGVASLSRTGSRRWRPFRRRPCSRAADAVIPPRIGRRGTEKTRGVSPYEQGGGVRTGVGPGCCRRCRRGGRLPGQPQHCATIPAVGTGSSSRSRQNVRALGVFGVLGAATAMRRYCGSVIGGRSAVQARGVMRSAPCGGDLGEGRRGHRPV